ncbi:MAG TPA: hypothetical protein VNB29_05910 [Chthoniobacterales bacterium]|nr:hypothetical protein [Chthoniobacterales bacterium]
MNRTTLRKTTYFTTVIGGAAAFVWSIKHFHFSPFGILLLVAILLLPGRILGFFYRDLMRGLRLLRAKEYAESKRHSELFLETLARKPWIRHVAWLGGGAYSRDPEALALNNLGCAEIGLADFGSSRLHLEQSIAVDPQNPLPYFNMGLAMNVQGEISAARAWFEKAHARGYSRSAIDAIISASQAAFACTDGRGKSR